MSNFPVISSILSPQQLAGFVQATYNLNNGTTGSLLKTGINHSYLINNGGQKFVLRVYSLNWRTQTEIAEEIRLLNLLKEKAISVSYPVADPSGNYIQQIPAPEGLRYAVLFSFAEGDKLLNFDADLHYKVGETMARIHQTVQDVQLERVTYTADVMLKQPFKQLDEFLPAHCDEMLWMLSAQKQLLAIIEQADTTQIRKGVVHMDIWFDNFNITKEGEVTLFDFDFCGNGWLCYDMAYYLLQLYSTEKDATEREAKKKSFLMGYESVVKISEQEMRLLPALGNSMYFFYLGIQCQRFDNWSNVFLNETYLKRFINLLVKKYFDDQVTPKLPGGFSE